MPCDVLVVAVFALLVVCAVFVGVAGGETETHMLILLSEGETWKDMGVDLAL
jgi:hypothetical protein